MARLPASPSLSLLCGALLSGCFSTELGPMPTAQPQDNDPAFHARLLEIAASYESFARVDDELHWAPFLCRQPMPSSPRRSASSDQDTHGRKLYFVFAKDRAAYLQRDGKDPAAVGQVVVKESWVAKSVPATTAYDIDQSPVRYMKEGEQLFHASERAGTFIMYRVAPATAGTDEGWVYGTVGQDGRTVTSAGRVRSCMGCHQQAPHQRLFGMDYHGA